MDLDRNFLNTELNGRKVFDIKGQTGGWRGVFRAAKGNYRLRVTEWNTKDVREKSISVSASSAAVNVDFQRVVVLTRPGHQSPTLVFREIAQQRTRVESPKSRPRASTPGFLSS